MLSRKLESKEVVNVFFVSFMKQVWKSSFFLFPKLLDIIGMWQQVGSAQVQIKLQVGHVHVSCPLCLLGWGGGVLGPKTQKNQIVRIRFAVILENSQWFNFPLSSLRFKDCTLK